MAILIDLIGFGLSTSRSSHKLKKDHEYNHENQDASGLLHLWTSIKGLPINQNHTKDSCQDTTDTGRGTYGSTTGTYGAKKVSTNSSNKISTHHMAKSDHAFKPTAENQLSYHIHYNMREAHMQENGRKKSPDLTGGNKSWILIKPLDSFPIRSQKVGV